MESPTTSAKTGAPGRSVTRIVTGHECNANPDIHRGRRRRRIARLRLLKEGPTAGGEILGVCSLIDGIHQRLGVQRFWEPVVDPEFGADFQAALFGG